MNEFVEKKSKWGKAGKVCLIIVAIILCIGGVAYSLTDVGRAASDYEKNHDESVRLGMVFDAKGSAALYQVPADENAYPQILAPLKDLSDLTKDTSPPTLTDEQFLPRWHDHESSFLELEKLAKLKHTVDQTEMSTHQMGTNNHFALMKGTMKSLMFRLRVASKQNDFALAQRLCRVASRLVVGIDEEPTLIAILVRSACESIVHYQLKPVLAHHGTESNWQSLLSETLATLDKPYDFRPAIRREHWEDLHGALVYLGSEHDAWIETPRGGNIDENYGGIPTEVKLLRLVPRYKRATIARIEECLNTTLRDYPSDLRDMDAVLKEFKKADDTMNHDGLSYKLAQMAGMRYQDLPKSLKSSTVQRYAMKQALAILISHQDPSRGLPLKGRFALDLDGNPFRIKHLPKGWIVYSIGRNGKDDGGLRDSNGQDDYIVDLSPATIVPPKKTPAYTPSIPLGAPPKSP